MAKTSLRLSQVYRLIEPGPVVLVSTMIGPQANIMTMSWQMTIDFEPPILACVISNRDYTFDIVRKTKECVINIPTVELGKKVVAYGNSSGRTVDKLKEFGLTPAKAAHARVPLVDGCYANLECKVVNTTLVNKYGVFVLEGWGPGSTVHKNIPAPFTIKARACLWWTARSSSCLPE